MLDISMSPHTLNNSEWAVFTIVKRVHNNERTPYDYLHLVFQEKLRGYHEQQTVIPNDRHYTSRKINCQNIKPAHFVITKRDFILRSSCLCTKYTLFFILNPHYTYKPHTYINNYIYVHCNTFIAIRSELQTKHAFLMGLLKLTKVSKTYYNAIMY